MRIPITVLVGLVVTALTLGACGQPTVEVSATRSPGASETSPLPSAVEFTSSPIPTTIRTDVAYGLVSLCSLYKPADLAALLGNRWELTDPTPGEAECFWRSARDTDSSTIITVSAIDLAEATTDAQPILEIATPAGPAVSVGGLGMRFVVNVTTNDIDPTRAASSELEAEMRIASDLHRRLR